MPVFSIFYGCQKVINVDLAEVAPRLVIDGLITDSIGPCRIILTKSGSFFNQPILAPVNGAVVVISDNTGTTETLQEAVPGIYFTSKLRGIPGRNYTLTVVSENKKYCGSAAMLSHVPIDSLKIVKSQAGGFGFGGNGKNEKPGND